MLISSCNLIGRSGATICVRPSYDDKESVKSAAQMGGYLSRRGSGKIKITDDSSRADYTISIWVNSRIRGDYRILRSEKEISLEARDIRTMRWLEYQTIRYLGGKFDSISVSDLPPVTADFNSPAIQKFAFSYRSIYLPSGINAEMQEILCLDDIGQSWAIWGHNLQKVLKDKTDENVYAVVNGKVYPEQLCFSSSTLFNKTDDYILNSFGDGKTKHYNFSIMPNDNKVACMCSACQAAGNTPGNATPAITRFIKKLAEKYPGHTFFTSSYMTTDQAPTEVLPPNMGVIISAIDFPRSSKAPTEKIANKITTWRKICNTVYIWDYINNFDDYYSPFPILLLMKQRLCLYRSLGVDGVFLNGSGYQFSTAEEQNTFVLAALLQNPDLLIDSIIKEYTQDAFPHYAEQLFSFNKWMGLQSMATGKELPMYGGSDSGFMFETVNLMRLFMSIEEPKNEYTLRERALINKFRHDTSYTLLEMARNGTFSFTEHQDVVQKALRQLAIVPEADELTVLLHREGALPQSVGKIDEAGSKISDYLNGCIIWLEARNWEKNLLFGQPLSLTVNGQTNRTKKLTDGVDGIGGNYHWGWTIVPQKDTRIDMPLEGISGRKHIRIRFLNLERHRISPPISVNVIADGKDLGVLKAFELEEMETLVFEDDMNIPTGTQTLSFTFTPSYTVDMGIDEIIISRK